MAAIAISLPVSPEASASISFNHYRIYPVGSEPAAVAVADVTGDGRKDILVTTTSLRDPPNDFKLFLFRQRTDGALASPERFPTFGGSGGYAYEGGLDTGDIDGDGKRDVAVALGRGINVYYQRHGDLVGPSRLTMRRRDGTPLPSYWPVGGIQPAIADVNGDGRNDIVIDHRISTYPNGIDLLRQAKHGFIQSPVARGFSGELEIADMNADGRPDILSGVDAWIHIFMNARGSSWRKQTLHRREWGIEAADVTGDHRADVVYASFFSGNDIVGVFPQRRGGRFRHGPRRYHSYQIPGAVEAARLNGDRRKDVVVIHSAWERVGVYRQRRDGRLSKEHLHEIPYCDSWPQSLALGDVSGDGLTDIAIACNHWGLVVLRQRGS